MRIVACYVPIKPPWLNAIEPEWVHGKRRVVEPARLLPAAELIDRVCSAFDCPTMLMSPFPALPLETAPVDRQATLDLDSSKRMRSV